MMDGAVKFFEFINGTVNNLQFKFSKHKQHFACKGAGHFPGAGIFSLRTWKYYYETYVNPLLQSLYYKS